MCELDSDWRLYGNGLTDKEKEHLIDYVKEIEDTELLAHLHRAKEIYDLLRSNGVEALEDEWKYETIEYKYKTVSHLFEFRVGVYVKELDRYGMWGEFFGDDKRYLSFYAGDENFTEKEFGPLNSSFAFPGKDYSTIYSEAYSE